MDEGTLLHQHGWLSAELRLAPLLMSCSNGDGCLSAPLALGVEQRAARGCTPLCIRAVCA
eukprot:4225384-Alexandrium_andersonii.AAC.1